MALTQVDQGLLGTYAQYTGFKNRIINGAMGIWQRGTSGFTTTGNYSADRWIATGGTLSAVAQSSDVPSNFKYSLSIAAAAYGASRQRIESVNCTDLSGATVTVSCWIKQTVGAGSSAMGIQIQYANATDNFSALTNIGSVSINTTSSWAQYTATFTNLPAGALNGIELSIFSSTGSSATFLVTGVQLEKGSTATSFDYRPYGTELALCQRYLPAFNSTSSTDPIASGVVMTTTNFRMTVPFNVMPRVPPTGISTTAASGFSIITNGTGYTANGISFLYGSQMSSIVQVSTASTMVVGQGGYVYANTTPGQILFTGCEL